MNKDRDDSMKDKMGKAADQVGDKAREMKEGARDKIEDMRREGGNDADREQKHADSTKQDWNKKSEGRDQR